MRTVQSTYCITSNVILFSPVELPSCFALLLGCVWLPSNDYVLVAVESKPTTLFWFLAGLGPEAANEALYIFSLLFLSFSAFVLIYLFAKVYSPSWVEDVQQDAEEPVYWVNSLQALKAFVVSSDSEQFAAVLFFFMCMRSAKTITKGHKALFIPKSFQWKVNIH